jgi:hypothetical protein
MEPNVSDDLVMDLRKGTMFDSDSALMWDAADEIERLRAVLEKIAAMDEICVTDFDGVNGWAHQWIARAALPKG